MNSSFRRVLIAGAGHMGCQIASALAGHGVHVLLYDRSPETLMRAESLLTSPLVSPVGSLTVEVGSCELVIESITENLKAKRAFFRELEQVMPEDTVFTTNSSMLLPSSIAARLKNKRRFCAFHFYAPAQGANIVDILPLKQTSPEIPERLRNFAFETGFKPVMVRKETRGYVFNSIFNSINASAISLVIRGVADIEDVDRSFRVNTGSSRGPFQMMDIVGLDTVYEITKNMSKTKPLYLFGLRFLKPYLDSGRLGIKTGEGFYKY